jgi:hypothetical protein
LTDESTWGAQLDRGGMPDDDVASYERRWEVLRLKVLGIAAYNGHHPTVLRMEIDDDALAIYYRASDLFIGPLAEPVSR